MTSRFLGLLATALLIGCGSDDTPTLEPEDGGFQPADGLPSDGADDTATGSDTSTVTDTGGTVTDTGGTVTDTGASSPMKCAAVTCDSKTQECCITGGIGSCTAKGGACVGIRYSCTSVDTCGAGQVCCVSGAGTGGASCTASASCPSTHTCKTNADCSGALKNCIDTGTIKLCSK